MTLDMFYFLFFECPSGRQKNHPTRSVNLLVQFPWLELSERHGRFERRFKAFVNALVIPTTAASFVALAAEKVARVRRAAHQFACASLFEPFRDGFLSFLHKKEDELKYFCQNL